MSRPCYSGVTLDGEAVEVSVAGSVIESARSIPNRPGLPRLLPALVDLQHNGSLGVPYNNLPSPAAEALWRVAECLLRHGVGRVLATYPSAPYPALESSACALATALDGDADLDAMFFGVFHEGVFISPREGWRGSHDPQSILPPDWERFRHLNDLSGNRVKLVNVAPEEPGALDFIARAAEAGIAVSVGHCCPDSATLAEAVKRGARMVTHFANGMAPVIHRFRNPLWGFLDHDELALGLIGDGFHLPPEVVRVAIRVKVPGRCFMVSDANPYAGCAPGSYRRLGGVDCLVEPNGFIHVAGQDILAGAWHQLDRGVVFLVEDAGLRFEDAWRMCSTAPAELIGLDLPRLRPGDEATFVVAELNGGKLHIDKTVFRGREYASDPVRQS